MNIKEAEALTGITKQNIRFYERKGLLSPQRNEENSYREYSKEDIERLQKIKMFRKLDISIENIQRIFDGESETTMIQQHLDSLLEKQSSLDAAIKMCRFLLQTKNKPIDTQTVLLKMEQIEQDGGRFMTIVNDYKKVASIEAKREFEFMPDSMVLNSEEFREALETYGRNENLNLVIKKEGMYPIFEIDGIEYEAYRQHHRFGAVIICKMTNPDLLKEEYKEIPEQKSKFYRRIHWAVTCCALPALLSLYFIFITKNLWLAALMCSVYIPIFWFYFRNFRLK